MFRYAAEIDAVVDGDTVDVTVDLGFRVSIRLRVRLAGCNAPERSTDAGRAAADAARAWVVEHGQAVEIATQKSPEKFGRWLATVVAADGHDLAADLIAAGHAVPWDGRGARPVPPAGP